MKKKILVLLSLIYVCNVYSQEVEKIAVLDEVKNIDYAAGLGGYPIGIYYNEIEDILVTQNTFPETIVKINLQTKEIREEKRKVPYFELIKNYTDFCLVKFILKTGRTHQIRVHSKYIGNPILGDTLYGMPSNLITRQALHCYKLRFIHPITKKN
jgi:hypothetical protein